MHNGRSTVVLFSKANFLEGELSPQRRLSELSAAATSTHVFLSRSSSVSPTACELRKAETGARPPLLFVAGVGLARTEGSVKAGTMEWSHLQYTKKREMTFCKCPGLNTQGRE